MTTVIGAAGARAADEGDLAKRRAFRDQLVRILPASPAWNDWLEKSGELPPDFDRLPSRPEPPDPWAGVSGPEGWPERRKEMLADLQRWVIGTVPPAPNNQRVEVMGERREDGATVRHVRLTFGPEHKASLRAEVMIPDGDGPFPVFLTQHTHRGWATIALRRGYIACIYAGADSQDDTDTFVEPYREYDFARLTRRGWAASRCIDYLLTLPQTDGDKIAIAGHSRNGKSSLMAAALDERIACVISSSSGVGGSMPSRLCSEQHFAEGIENITRTFPDWFHPRWRFFVGREDRMPVDLHQLVALAAPRACLFSTAMNDGVESVWAIEESYLAVRPVWEKLGAAEKVRILWRGGGHETWTDTVERYMDWCDRQFGRGDAVFADRFFYPHAALGDSGITAGTPPAAAPAPRTKAQVAAAVREMLGEAPPRVSAPGGGYGREAAHVATLLNRNSVPADVEKEQVVFGEYIAGDVYYPAGLKESGKTAPAVLWLHPASFASGYMPAYRRGAPVHLTLAKRGYVVFCFDQIGHGRRIEEGEGFYRRHPRWSLLGKMVRDTQAALDSLTALPYVDATQVYGLGFGLGSLVGLHVAALDDRLAGFASVCGPAPLASGDLARWTRHALAPRLGSYLGREDALPYDVPDLLAALAPRPTLVVSPTLDREAPVAAVTQAVETARAAWKAQDAAAKLAQVSPEDYAHFDERMQAHVAAWLDGQNGR